MNESTETRSTSTLGLLILTVIKPLLHHYNKHNSGHLRLRTYAMFSLNTGTREVKALHCKIRPF